MSAARRGTTGGGPAGRALRQAALGTAAWTAAAEAAPLAQASSERLALTVAALIAVAVLAILGGLLILVLRRQGDQGQAHAGGTAAGADDRALWAAAGTNGAVRADGDLDEADDRDPRALDDADARDPRALDDADDRDGLDPGDARRPGAVTEGAVAAGDGPDRTPDGDAHGVANGTGPAADAPAFERPVVRPPLPGEAWTAEIAWEADPARFRVLARRPQDAGTAPVALAQTETLPWPPKDDASVQAMTDASATLESVLLDSGWSALPAGDAWYAKRFAWEPQAAGGQVRPGSGRFERREAGAPEPEPVPPDAERRR